VLWQQLLDSLADDCEADGGGARENYEGDSSDDGGGGGGSNSATASNSRRSNGSGSGGGDNGGGGSSGGGWLSCADPVAAHARFAEWTAIEYKLRPSTRLARSGGRCTYSEEFWRQVMLDFRTAEEAAGRLH
jgi:hypothetical protein